MSDWERPSLSSGAASGRGGPKKKPGRLRAVFWGVVAVAVVGFGWVSWSAYRSSQSIEDAGMVPLLKADNSPSRIRPDDPGGMTVPNQDKQIYDRIDPKRAAPAGLERLLPPPEQPVGRPAAIPTLQRDDGTGAREVSTPVVRAAPEPPAPPKSATPPANAVPSPFTKVEPPPAPPKGQAARPAPEKAAPAEKPAPQQVAAAPRAPASTAPISGAKIQLAAVGSEDAAQKEWDRLKRASGGLLDSVNPAFVRADLGEKGVVYRIQAGPLASADAAADLCSKLKARNVGCFVAR